MSTVVDKNGILSGQLSAGPFILELGCGTRKRIAGSIGIDALDYPAVDIVGDVFEILGKLPASSVDKVYAHHFVEHIDDLNRLMSELARILKPGGLIEFVAPHFSSPYFYSDPTHRSFFGLYTFCYLSVDSPFRRKVPTYQRELFFALENVELRFQSPRPFYIRYALKRIIGCLFNSCTFMKELYEENFCYLCPCYEIVYQLKRL